LNGRGTDRQGRVSKRWRRRWTLLNAARLNVVLLTVVVDFRLR
jgi:hypothetical protein